MRFALFDLDHTLLPHDTQPLFCNFVLKREPWRVLLHAIFLPFALLRALGMAPLTLAKRAFMAFLWRMPQERLSRYAREFAQSEVRPRAYPELLAEMRRHRAEGRVLVLNTASPVIYAPAIAEALGFDHCVATPVILDDPMPMLPKLAGPNNKHEQKIPNMEALVPGLKSLDPASRAECWSYSDSRADIPLLEFSGHRVLVHPSPALAARFPEATILRPARPYHGKTGDMLAVARQFLGLY